MRRRFFNIKKLLNNFISYSSSDNQIVTPYTTDFGAVLLKNVMIEGIGTLLFKSNVTKIGLTAFYNCATLKSITIPDSVTTIGASAFNGCASLTSITIPDSVTSIGNTAFSNCYNLISVNIPDNVTEIGARVFCNCQSLTSITIPNGVTTIGERAFSDCSSLTSVTIPDSVTEIWKYAFYYCRSLKTVYCKRTTPPTGGLYMFSSNASDRKIYVPYQSLDAYKTAQYWSEYADAIVGYDFENDVVIITFTVNGVEYQAEEGMTFYDWAMSEYFDSSCNLRLSVSSADNLRDDIINMNVSSNDSAPIMWNGISPMMPHINTDTIIQSTSYMSNSGAYD